MQIAQRDKSIKKIKIMSSEILDKYIAAWNSGKLESVMPFFSNDIVYQDLALKKSLDYNSLEDFIKNSFKNNKELRFEKVSACVTQNCIAWEWRMIRVRNTGEKLEVPGMSMTEFADGKIIRNRDYWSTLPTPN